ncbi:unnamed protein product [Amoebophrya sp. A120]|nr:unnamed protein product [Amoebophrya sp. A120]|eukprot:GSA120T00008306001.1
MPTKPKERKDLGNVDIGDFNRDVYQNEKELDAAGQAVARENAMLSGAVLLVGVQTAIENGALEDTCDAVAGLEQFAKDGAELAKPVLEFLRDGAAQIAAELNEENLKLLLNACKNLGEMGLEAFQVLGAKIAEGAQAAGKAIESIDWETLGSDAAAMAKAAGEAMKEAGRTAGKLMSDAWEQLTADEKTEAAGGDEEKASGISKGLEELSKTGSGLAADAIEVLGNVLEKMKDEAVNLLQKAVGVLARAGIDDMFKQLWEKLSELVGQLAEAGRAVAPVVLENIGSAVDVVQDFGAEMMNGAAAEAARENAAAAAGILLGALEQVPDVAEDAVSALNKMKSDAAPLVGKALEQVKGVLDAAVAKLADVDVDKLQKAVAYAAQSGMAGMQDLFAALSSVVGAAISAGRQALSQVEMPDLEQFKPLLQNGAAIVAFVALAPVGLTAAIGIAAAELAKDDVKKAGKMMLEALDKLYAEGQEVSEDAYNAVKQMAEEGAALSGEAATAVSGAVAGLLEKIPDVDVEDLQRAVGAAAKAGIEGMQQLWDVLSEAVDAAVAAGRELAKVDWESIVVAGGDFMAQGAEIAAKGFGELGDVYKVARSEVTDAINALAGATVTGCAACMDLIKLEIFRDVFQALGLFFSKLFAGLSEGAGAVGAAIWGFVGNLIAIDWGAMIPVETLIIIGIVLLVIVAVLVVISFAYFLYVAITQQQDELREGHEAESWSDKKKTQGRKVWFMTQVLTAALSIYLPLTRTCIEILYCDVPFDHQLKDGLKEDMFRCDSGLMTGIAYFFGIFFVIPLPILAFWLISKNKPQGSPENPDLTYDDDGIEVEFTDKLYHERVMTDPDQIACPYRSLYMGFERKAAWYKVAMMLFKLALVLPVIFLAKKWDTAAAQTSGTTSAPEMKGIIIYDQYQKCIDNPTSYLDFTGLSPGDVKITVSLHYSINNPGAVADFSKDAAGCNDLFKDAFSIEDTPAQGGATFGVVFAFALLSFYFTPFVDPNSDRMDIMGRVAMSATTLIAVIYATGVKQGSGGDMVLGIALNVVNAINFIYLTFCIVTGFPCIRSWWKNKIGRIDFSDTSFKNLRFLSCKEAVPDWDLYREIKHRIWHAFWNTVLLNACGEEVAARMLELKEKTRQFGIEKIKMHWAGFKDPKTFAMRMEARKQYEGVDLYWDDATGPLDKNLDSASCFGKMYIDPYPFHMVMVYDDCDDVAFLWGPEKLEQFLNLQKREDIVAKVYNRRRFRGLSLSGGEFELPFSRQESETVPDGTRTVTDKDGNSHQEQVFSTVTFECYYTNGAVNVGANTDKKFAAGFDVSMTYRDGYGDAIKPRTCEPVHFSNRVATLGRDHVGLDSSFDLTDRMNEVFAASQHLWEPQLEPLQEAAQAYRSDLVASFEAKKGILHNGFWYYVYNNSQISRKELLQYINDYETNPTLKTFPTDHQAGLNFLFLRMQAVKHPVAAFWFCLWDDIWEENKDMAALKDLEDDIAPTSGNSIAYRPMEREKLQQWLEERNLWGGTSQGCCCCGDYLFTEAMLDVIYERFEKEKQGVAAGV